MLLKDRQASFLAKIVDERMQRAWADAIERYLRAAKLAKKWSNNPHTYAEIFRLNIREEFKDYPEALKAFDQIDEELNNA